MKSNAIVRIIIYIVIILLLCSILAVGIGVGTLRFQIGNRNDLSEGSGNVKADTINKLEIEWVAGEIILQTAEETDIISFTEEGSYTVEMPMGYQINGNTLVLCFSSKDSIQLGFTSSASKDLIITVPKDWVCDELVIQSASTDATVSNLTVDLVEIDSASNRFAFHNCNISILNVDGASNEIDITGCLEELDSDGMSAKITAVLTNTPRRVDLDGMSNHFELTLPLDCGFNVTMDGMSNQFSSDFETKIINGNYTYGDRRCQITVDGMSNEVYIYQRK